MSKETTQKKRSKDPKTWEGFEKEHSQVVGDIVRVQHFGQITNGWKVEELTRDEDTGGASYVLRGPDKLRHPHMTKWFGNATFSQIV